MTYDDEVQDFIARSVVHIAQRAHNGGGPGGAERVTDLTLRLSDFLVTLGDNVLPQDRTLRLIHLLNDRLAYTLPLGSDLNVRFLAPVAGTVVAPAADLGLRLTFTGQPTSVEILSGAGRSLGFAQRVGTEYRLAVKAPATLGLASFNARAVDARGRVATDSVFVQVTLTEYGTVTPVDAQGDDSVAFVDVIAS